jgi:hypothetical protein
MIGRIKGKISGCFVCFKKQRKMLTAAMNSVFTLLPNSRTIQVKAKKNRAAFIQLCPTLPG